MKLSGEAIEAAGKACFGFWRDLTKTLSAAEIDEAWQEKLNQPARDIWMECGRRAMDAGRAALNGAEQAPKTHPPTTGTTATHVTDLRGWIKEPKLYD